jgi:biotin operon repressor
MGKTSGAAIQEKIRMLEDEGVEFQGERVKNFDEILFRLS